MSGYQLTIEDYSKQNSSKIFKKFIFYISLIAVIFLSVYFIIILDTDWHRIGSGAAILKQLSYFILMVRVIGSTGTCLNTGAIFQHQQFQGAITATPACRTNSLS